MNVFLCLRDNVDSLEFLSFLNSFIVEIASAQTILVAKMLKGNEIIGRVTHS